MTFPNGHTYADVGAQPVPRLGIRGLSEVASDGIMMEGMRSRSSADCNSILDSRAGVGVCC